MCVLKFNMCLCFSGVCENGDGDFGFVVPDPEIEDGGGGNGDVWYDGGVG